MEAKIYPPYYVVQATREHHEYGDSQSPHRTIKTERIIREKLGELYEAMADFRVKYESPTSVWEDGCIVSFSDIEYVEETEPFYSHLLEDTLSWKTHLEKLRLQAEEDAAQKAAEEAEKIASAKRHQEWLREREEEKAEIVRLRAIHGKLKETNPVLLAELTKSIPQEVPLEQ